MDKGNGGRGKYGGSLKKLLVKKGTNE